MPGKRVSLTERLERHCLGRLAMSSMRWAVVFALICSGYFGAAAIRAGLHHASSANDAQPILASTPSRR
jgi:hypothetical protein